MAEYLVDLNGTQAAIRAGFSQKTATELAYKTLSRPAVAAALAQEQAKRLAAIDFSAADVIRELSAIARGNVLDCLRIDARGNAALDLSGLDRMRAAALAEIAVEHPVGRRRAGCRRILIRTHDKVAALDRLARHYGLYGERVIEETVDGAPQEDSREAVGAVLAFIREALPKAPANG